MATPADLTRLRDRGPAAVCDGRPALCVSLLGTFRVVAGGRPVDDAGWRLRKARAVVKLLALAPDHRLPRERLLDLLWPDLPPDAAANNLRYALHVARRALTGDGSPALTYLRTEGDQVHLYPGGEVRTDVAAFRAAVAAARGRGDPARYAAAAALYPGDLLPEDPDADWAAAPRVSLRALHVELLLEQAAVAEAAGDGAGSAAVLARALAADPAAEGAHRGLMRLYARAGQRHLALRQYRYLSEALRRELDAEPDPASRRLYRDIRAGAFPAGAPAAGPPAGARPGRRHNLPAPITSFVGRERELREVTRLLAAARLVTLTGTGGCGKTRLALQVAGRIAGQPRGFPGGVWLVELASLADPALVPRAVADALGVRERPGVPLLQTLAGALAGRPLLLVLDSCEHLLGACAALAGALLGACPGLRVLATSREPLGVAGETACAVLPLPLPPIAPDPDPDLGALMGHAAVRLFVERAGFARPGFALTAQNAPAVVHICRRLDGLPLAIELAAARMSGLSPLQLAERLDEGRPDDRFRLLTGGNRAAPAHHQTLRTLVDWSYGRLTRAERDLFARLSVFAGGFSLAAAERVAAAPGAAVPRLLGRLVAKSLVVDGAGPAHEGHYRLFETLRQYARERLLESETAADLPTG